MLLWRYILLHNDVPGRTGNLNNTELNHAAT